MDHHRDNHCVDISTDYSLLPSIGWDSIGRPTCHEHAPYPMTMETDRSRDSVEALPRL